VNGHLRISGTGKSTLLERRDGGKSMPAPERTMESRLFGSRPSLLLDESNHEPLRKARSALQEGLSDAYLGKLFRNNFGWSGLGLAASILLVVAVIACVVMTRSQDQAATLLVGMLLPAPFIMGGSALAYAGWQHERWGWLLAIAGIALMVGSAVVGLVIMSANARGVVDLVPAVAPFALASIVGLAFRWLQAPTVAGRKIMDQIEGFRLYLGVAEEDRLDALNPPDKTPELFERFLPYAVALDVENRWAQRFAGVLAAAGTTAVAASWYAGNQNWTQNPVAFADHLSNDLSQTIAAASTPPGSSSDGGGSSGGGSSGGGGGGGGGSGW
jgi:hypothetical protein